MIEEGAGDPKAQIIHGRQPRRELTEGSQPLVCGLHPGNKMSDFDI